jgi:hypothetical protein
MGKQRTVHGPYGGDDLGKDATGPLRVTEMDRERTRPKSVADGQSFADLVDCNSNEESNYGMAASVKRRRR